jgi:hypothetical protein
VRPTKRTTAPRVKRVDLDLDAILDEELADDTPAETKVFSMGGETYTVRCRVNEFLLTSALGGDNSAVLRFFESLMPADDFRRFKTAMGEHDNMTVERFGKIFARILELVSERPTN